ncbi:HRDC domain-containing protein [Brevibacterium album]|uniref:HRDC domain-containing protein n=1 Tax=Brevibacterium album TaxID=417948 RepID=UPI0003FDE9D0|nr:HRDC domain-containing protein [Brevibacterium album]
MSANDVSPDLPLLSEPAEGLPEVASTPDALRAAVTRLEAGNGSVAVDAERASGFRYGQRAFLVQLRRAGAGTVLVDPEPFSSLAILDEALRGTEWVLHAATQDLPCLSDLDMRPDALFDTELAARLLGYERFGLAAVVGETMGVRLAKEHSAVDWSTRPLPEAWLSYAALDVEILLEVADVLDAQLHARGLAEYAQQEFEHLLEFAPPVREEPWRRMHGLGSLRTPRQLARAREVWLARDALGRAEDRAPSLLLRDREIAALAAARIRTADDVFRAVGTGRLTRKDARRWCEALRRADSLPDDELPARRPAGERSGPRVDRTLVRDRTGALREAMRSLADDTGIPHDLLLQPALVKALAARPDLAPGGRLPGGSQSSAELSAAVEAFLRGEGARDWQLSLSVPVLVRALERMPRD